MADRSIGNVFAPLPSLGEIGPEPHEVPAQVPFLFTEEREPVGVDVSQSEEHLGGVVCTDPAWIRGHGQAVREPVQVRP